jgi:hypothetical protein
MTQTHPATPNADRLGTRVNWSVPSHRFDPGTSCRSEQSCKWKARRETLRSRSTDILNIDIAKRLRDQWSVPARKTFRRRLIEHRSNALVGRLGVDRRRTGTRQVVESGKSVAGITPPPYAHCARRRLQLASTIPASSRPGPPLQQMRAELQRVEADAFDPFVDGPMLTAEEHSVLPRCRVATSAHRSRAGRPHHTSVLSAGKPAAWQPPPPVVPGQDYKN